MSLPSRGAVVRKLFVGLSWLALLPASADSQAVPGSLPDSLRFSVDSVPVGGSLDVVLGKPRVPDARRDSLIWFDAHPARTLAVAGDLVRVVVPGGLLRGSRPIVSFRRGEAVVAAPGPVIVPFRILSVTPERASPNQAVVLELSRYVNATVGGDAPDVRILVGESTVVFQAASETSVGGRLPTKISGALLETLLGRRTPSLRVVIDGEVSESYERLTLVTPFWPDRARLWYLVLGAPTALLLIMYNSRFRARASATKLSRTALPAIRRGEAGESSSLAPKPPAPPPTDLFQRISAGECVLFAGPGLGAQSGLSTWSQFLGGLINRTLEAGSIAGEDHERLQGSLAEGLTDAVGAELEALLPPSEVRAYTESALGGARPSKTHKRLAKVPFAAALTTSFDTLLAQAFAVEPLVPGDTDALVSALRDDRFFLLQLQGSTAAPADLWLAPEDLNRHLLNDTTFRQALSTLFQRYTFLFVGTSLEGIDTYVKNLELSPQQSRTHYALVGSTGRLDTTLVKKLGRQHRIETIDFRTDGTYSEVRVFVEQLPTRTSDAAAPAGRTDRPILERVTLTNIGPFEELDLSFHESWNVLLGDNGVGKTVLLRSIAAALCGESIRNAPPAARETVESLLRSGCDKGRIQLYIGTRSYEVVLEKDSSDRVRVRSDSLSPLLFDKMLVLGFPALRKLSRERPMGTSDIAELGQPNLDDLLPLLTGEPDGRMSSLKVWILGLDHRRLQGDTAAAETLASLWKLLDSCTPDIRIDPPGPDGIDARTGEIRICTDDGEVPFEVISQGTASLFCWAGTVLQRHRSVYGTSPAEAARSAVVLVDEIGANMHPQWQQQLIASLDASAVLQDVQYIVTTHSPLIIGGLEHGNVISMRRDADHRVEMSVGAGSVFGWRAEDIYRFMGLEQSRAEEFRGRIEEYRSLHRLALKERLDDRQEARLTELKHDLDRLPESDPVTLTSELDNIATLLDEPVERGAS